MEQLTQAATLLYAVLGDMDEIPVEGMDKQKTFLACADGIRTAAQVILQYVETEKRKPGAVTSVNGEPPVMKNLEKEEKADGR